MWNLKGAPVIVSGSCSFPKSHISRSRATTSEHLIMLFASMTLQASLTQTRQENRFSESSNTLGTSIGIARNNPHTSSKVLVTISPKCTEHYWHTYMTLRRRPTNLDNDTDCCRWWGFERLISLLEFPGTLKIGCVEFNCCRGVDWE